VIVCGYDCANKLETTSSWEKCSLDGSVRVLFISEVRKSVLGLVRLMALGLLLNCSACAVDYFDSQTGVEHVWGVGHLAMKIDRPYQGLKATGWRSDSIGLSLGESEPGYHFSLGWNSYQQIDVVDQNTQLCVAWPTATFYNVRVGSEPPSNSSTCGPEEKERNP